MPRISRKTEIERRNKLIKIAEELFLVNGYENTTINDIVERLNLAKGTFYYHFRSKEELLVAVSDKLLSETQNYLQRVHDRKDEDIFARLKDMLTAIDIDLYRNERIWRFVYHENNVILYNQLIKICKEKLGPLIADVLEEGSGKGLLDVPHAMEMAEALIILLDLYAKQICSEDDRSKRMRVHVTIRHILERMLDKRCVPDFGMMDTERVKTA